MDENQARYFALLLKARRKQKGWSQESVCKGVCAVSYYSKIESGIVIPNIQILEELAKHLQMELPILKNERQDRIDESAAGKKPDDLSEQSLENPENSGYLSQIAKSSETSASVMKMIRSGHLDEAYELFMKSLKSENVSSSNPLNRSDGAMDRGIDESDTVDHSLANSTASKTESADNYGRSGKTIADLPDAGRDIESTNNDFSNPCDRTLKYDTELASHWFDLSHPCSLDTLLLLGLYQKIDLSSLFEPEELLACLNREQKALFFIACNEYKRAPDYCDDGWVLLLSAFGLYRERKTSDSKVLVQLEQAYLKAAKEGYAYLMAQVSHIMGMVYSNIPDYASAMEYFTRTQRLLEELGDQKDLDELYYNIGCTLLEEGKYEEALEKLEAVHVYSVMDIQKQVICLELMNRKEEALERMKQYKQADRVGWDPDFVERLFELIRIRLVEEDWIHNSHYGDLLLGIYEELLNTADSHKGFAQFHLPWVIQYLKANRQYAKAASILENFPGKLPFTLP